MQDMAIIIIILERCIIMTAMMMGMKVLKAQQLKKVSALVAIGVEGSRELVSKEGILHENILRTKKSA